MTDHAGAAAPEPVLRVVRGQPDAAELAAVVAVVTASRSPTDGGPRPLSVWAARSRLVRPQLRPAAGAWRASAWPR
ncbi:MAG: acyl-CoA carboxylase subunit epsilon [Actinomycetota bacterium]|nr:acyl-CoA carboxylase subunit epsilon [Actinomycetota bacterium]MDH5277459.1 acyl-CoA carboxylase subunit epsilon [Actinomycetota bacterium]